MHIAKQNGLVLKGVSPFLINPFFMQITEYLAKIIDIPSPTGKEHALCDTLKSDLSAAGFHCELMPVTADRYNLFAYFGEQPTIVLTTHLDTVPPVINAKIEKNKIFGRGACDAKGQIAAMKFAVMGLPDDIKKNVGLLFVVGEETDSIGAKKVVESGFATEFFINGEPTQNTCARGQKGVFIFHLHATGKAAHSGYPEAGDSALSKLLRQLYILEKLQWGKDPVFGEATFNIGKITGGDAANVIAAEASAECAIRITRGCDEAKSLLDSRLLEGISYEVITDSDPIKLFVPAGFASDVVKYGSDAAYLSKIAKTAMLGPGSILNAHKPDEHIDITELEQAVGIYQKMIKSILTH